jgi:hypothetical protein
MTLLYYWKNISSPLLCYIKNHEVQFEDMPHEVLHFFARERNGAGREKGGDGGARPLLNPA